MSQFQRRALLSMTVGGVILAILNCGGSDGPAKSNGITKVTVSAAASGLDTPLDATPDPMGTTIYFIAKAAMGEPGVFSVPAAGGTVTTLYSGMPLVKPIGISTSSDGKTIYIADPGAGTDGKGVIFAMPSSGDTPVVVKGSESLQPNALDVMEMGMNDDIYFTGTDATSEPAVYKLPAEGGTATVVLKGAPLLKPGGIALATDATIYVTDAQAGMSEPGRLFKISGGKGESVGPDFNPGTPAGVAITLDDAKVFSSALSSSGTSEVSVVNVTNGTSAVYNQVIGSNTVSGGIHRARFKDVFAWAGYTQVYYIKTTTLLSDSSTPGGVGVR